jgi:hypothetical protein
MHSLPRRHEQYLFEELRKLCVSYLRRNGVATSEISADQLFSEVCLRLVSAAALPNDEAQFPFPTQDDWNDDPERDSRVVWLIKEIGGLRALAHRCEDIRRSRWGRATSEGGRRTIQPDDEDEALEIGEDPVVDQPFHEADARRAWTGLLITVTREFGQEEDAAKLVRLLAQDIHIFEESYGGRWPVRAMVHLLNQRFPPPTWTDHRVDDAKKRVVNWIKRLRRKNGLDSTDLEAFFARVARYQEHGERALPPNFRSAELQS